MKEGQEEEKFKRVGVLWQYEEIKKVNVPIVGVVSAWSSLSINMLILLPGL